MTPGEAWRAVHTLLNDTSSHIAVAVAGWEFTASREYLATADLYDLTWMSAKRRGKFKPYPRPWPDRDKSKFGKTDMAPSKVRGLLRRMARGGDDA